MKPPDEPGAPSSKEASSSTAERTILFADVCGSSRLFDQRGNEAALQIVGRAVEVLSRQTTRHGGTVIKTIGDEVMATFPDAADAVEAALAMHEAVASDAVLAEIGVSIKIGMHAGEVILERGDVFGDAVNVAARMVSLAKADQILTTRMTEAQLPPTLRRGTRGLGRTRVRGKSEPIELCEVVWHQDTAVLTSIGALPWSERRDEGGSRLVLENAARRFVVEAQGAAFRIGRGEENDLVVHGQGVSRTHATVEYNKGYFVLTDRSTNGTHVRIGTEEIFLHRDQIHLLSEGVISPGRALAAGATPSEASAWIRYWCE